MDAKKALELTIHNWCENEETLMQYVIGYHEKVETAAKSGKVNCAVGVVPTEHLDFVAGFYERLGFYVIFLPVSPTEHAVRLDWHAIPITRHLAANEKFAKSIIELE